jgi:iron complex outermembrane recepter protein
MATNTRLFCGTALLLFPLQVQAQDRLPDETGQPPSGELEADPVEYEYVEEEDGTIVVTGVRTLLGDIPPENVLDARDVRATGATNISELLEAIAPQTGSARGRGGGRPIMLLNGQRVSSFRELRDIPAEAIARVEILPEEVALRYGYRADQRVVNIVLRGRFRSTTAQIGATAATDGGYSGGDANVTRMMIGENTRTTLDFKVQTNTALAENERNILLENPPAAGAPDPRAARTLIGSRREVTATGTHNRQLGQVSATGNVELSHNRGRSLIGLGEVLIEPLARDTVRDSAHAGAAFNGTLGDWRWSVTGNANAARSVTTTDRDLAEARDRTVTDTRSGDIDAVANGSLFQLPAGRSGTTVRVGARTINLDSDRRRGDVASATSLGRTTGFAALNLDLPVSRRNSDFDALGNLTLNANGEVEQLSDFGTLTTIGAGVNWSPAQRLNLIASWTREEGAPSMQQLGDPVLETPGSRIFDFTTGRTVLVTAVTGGNPGLASDRRNVVKLGGNWRPLEETDLTIRGEYVRSLLDDPVSSFPGPTPTLEAAFPERFVRNAQGELVSVDFRPVNFESARRDTLRIGFDFSKPLRSAPPSPAAIEALRARRGAAGQERPAPAPEGAAEGAQPQRGQGPPGGLRGFGGFGGRDGGRLQFSLTDTITFVDRVTIRDDLTLDYLRGDAIGRTGGRPRHHVEARAGYFNNGLGARLSANWRSGTQVTTAAGDKLRFSPLATFDVRTWVNFGQRPDLIARHPWLRGASAHIEASNLFNARPQVRNAAGQVPFGFQPGLLDPLGRTISISFRKLFLPPPGAWRRGERGGRGSRGPGGEDY